MPIGLSREALSRSFAEDHPDNPFKDDIQKDVKIFPILVINTGSLAACSAMASKGYTIKSWIKLWAEELVLARNCVTEVLFPLLRPDLPTTYQNRHFHSAETLETIFMRQVLQEVQQRCFAVSIIWLHDGFWICSSVRDDIIRRQSKLRLSRYSLIVAKRKEYCGSQVYQRKLKLLKISWLPSSHLFFSLIVVRVNGGPLSLQESSRRPSLAAVR